jgi:hypothetical protein
MAVKSIYECFPGRIVRADVRRHASLPRQPRSRARSGVVSFDNTCAGLAVSGP